MMSKYVGVRELKNKATQIVRQVREHGARFTVTVDNVAVAQLVPFRDESSAHRKSQRLMALDRIDAIANRITSKWPSNLSAVEAVRLQRR